jgi:hypothetical protein
MRFAVRGEPIPPGYKLVFRAYYTQQDGVRVYARAHGLRAWPFLVPIA